jgi:hypothetical protein
MKAYIKESSAHIYSFVLSLVQSHQANSDSKLEDTVCRPLFFIGCRQRWAVDYSHREQVNRSWLFEFLTPVARRMRFEFKVYSSVYVQDKRLLDLLFGTQDLRLDKNRSFFLQTLHSVEHGRIIAAYIIATQTIYSYPLVD